MKNCTTLSIPATMLLSVLLSILVLVFIPTLSVAPVTSIWVQSFQLSPQPTQPLTALNSFCDVPQSTDVTSLPLQHQSTQPHHRHTNGICGTNSSGNKMSRRILLKTIYRSLTTSIISATALSFIATIFPAPAAYALQPRNEPLCSTGLFEHFLEYKCTPIGDIQDEGIGKELTSKEEEATNSLMSKLGIDSNDTKTSIQRNVSLDRYRHVQHH